MNIKKRLIIYNVINIIVPITITLIVALLFINISYKLYNRDIKYDKFESIAQIKSQLSKLSEGIVKEEINSTEIPELQNYLENALLMHKGKYIITKGENNSVAFSKNISSFEAQNCINEVNNNKIEPNININNVSYIYDVSNIKYSDGNTGNIILLIPIDGDFDIIKRFIIVIIFTFIISSLLVNTTSSVLFSKKIVKPVTLLKKATSEISDGNLDCEIIEDGDLEIRELCHSFEKMRIQLKDSVRLKLRYDDDRKMLVSSISHDLKTPLTAIKGYVEGVIDGVANSEEKKEMYLKTIYRKAKQMDLMIDDLLLYSKLDLNQIPFVFTKTDVLEYFKYCIADSSIELAKSNIEIGLTNNISGSRFAMIDVERMRRVIMNIIDNSRKYMDKDNGRIDIRLRDTHLSIIIEIRDNGQGISQTEINNIFDRFYRADSARSGAHGSGLGLAIAKQIIEGHNGKIWAISHQNEGTSILISIAKI
jgi:signal transduction histidine kinase